MLNEQESLTNMVMRYQSNPREELREKIIANSMKVIETFARKFSFKLDFDDLVSIGMIATIKAIETFDHTKKAEFNTYLYNKIRGDILHTIRDTAGVIRYPAWISEQLVKVDNTRQLLKGQLHREPTDDEMARAMKLPFEKYVDIIKHEPARHTCSLEQTVFNSDADNMSMPNLIVAMDAIAGLDGRPIERQAPDTALERVEELRMIKRNYLDKKVTIRAICRDLGLQRSKARGVLKTLLATEWL